MYRRKVLWMLGGFSMILLLMVLSGLQRGLSFQEPSRANPAVSSEAIRQAAAQPVLRQPLGGDIDPETKVWDPFPTFNGIAVDHENNRVVMSDVNRQGILMYDRMANSESGELTPPLRHVFGPATEMGFVAGIQMDPEKREVYVAENDGSGLRVFSYDDQGNAKPRRHLATPHQVWGMSLNRARQELAITVQELGAVLVYKQEADKLEPPLRVIRGKKTGMADPHGVYLDSINNELVVANHGSHTTYYPYTSYLDLPKAIPTSTGRIDPPSITVYPATAKGDVEPIRVIQGERTGLDWPMQVDVDTSRNEIAVANFGGDSILIFNRTDQGDAGPARVIGGARTGIVGPIGGSFDLKNDEIWVANYGDHTAVVFPRTANGNVPPKRIIRNAPEGSATCGFTNAAAVAYDSKRKEILVAN